MRGNFQKVSFRKLRRNRLPGDNLFFLFLYRNISNHLIEGNLSFSKEVVFGGVLSDFEEENPGF